MEKRPARDGLARWVLRFVAVVVFCDAMVLWAEAPTKKKENPGASPPKWSADDLNTFFPDARAKLVGTRPDYQEAQELAAASKTADSDADASPTKDTNGWSKLIDAETIETEIKRLAPEVATHTKTPSGFKGGAYKECRREFSLLAMLFAISAEYDGEVRWQEVAPALRDLFSRAGHNCKAGSDQTFQEAVLRKQDLIDLIAGNRPRLKSAEPKADWSKVADRPPLMERLNIAHEDRLKKWLANKNEFTAHQDDIRYEAQLVAAIADVIGREGFENWDDETYAHYAQELRQAAAEASAAVENGNFEQARQANNRMTKACADCHEGFRS